MMRLDPGLKYIIKCKKCGKDFSIVKLKEPSKYFVKCCNKKVYVTTQDTIKIQKSEYKCPDCNQKVKCYCNEYKCPHCGAINIKEYCFKPSTQEERDKRLREQIKSGILY